MLPADPAGAGRKFRLVASAQVWRARATSRCQVAAGAVAFRVANRVLRAPSVAVPSARKLYVRLVVDQLIPDRTYGLARSSRASSRSPACRRWVRVDDDTSGPPSPSGAA